MLAKVSVLHRGTVQGFEPIAAHVISFVIITLNVLMSSVSFVYSFNYGDRFWSVKKKEFYCECGTPSCKYRDPRS